MDRPMRVIALNATFGIVLGVSSFFVLPDTDLIKIAVLVTAILVSMFVVVVTDKE